MRLPSLYVVKRSGAVTIIAAMISISVSTGIRLILGVHSDAITVVVRLVLPFVIAIPLSLIWFTRLEALEKAYHDAVRQANELFRSASSDPLTGLLNRRAFIELFDGTMQMGVRGWFLIADIDYLKAINDQYGHPVGDDAIVSVAEAMQDKLPANSLIARIGGDEFCAFVTENNLMAVEALVNHLNRKASDIFRLRRPGTSHRLSVSVGFIAPKPKQSFVEVMAMTDERLYRKKRARLKGEA